MNTSTGLDCGDSNEVVPSWMHLNYFSKRPLGRYSRVFTDQNHVSHMDVPRGVMPFGESTNVGNVFRRPTLPKVAD